jgi:HEAT repeat protein
MYRTLFLRCAAAATLLLGGCGDSPSPVVSFHQIPIPENALPELREILERLNSPEPQQRAFAARQLAATQLPHDDVVDYLLLALRDGNALVREAAAQSLGTLGAKTAVGPLLEVLERGSEDRNVRSAAAEALGKLQAPSATDALCAALRDPVWNVRYAAAVALGRIGKPSARDALANCVRYEANNFVRSAAQESLAQLESVAEQASVE